MRQRSNCRDYKSNKIFFAAFVVGFVVGGVDPRLAVAARIGTAAGIVYNSGRKSDVWNKPDLLVND